MGKLRAENEEMKSKENQNKEDIEFFIEQEKKMKEKVFEMQAEMEKNKEFESKQRAEQMKAITGHYNRQLEEARYNTMCELTQRGEKIKEIEAQKKNS